MGGDDRSVHGDVCMGVGYCGARSIVHSGVDQVIHIKVRGVSCTLCLSKLLFRYHYYIDTSCRYVKPCCSKQAGPTSTMSVT